jgi:hypothetical protein
MVQTANAALMERTPFAIDDAKDDDDDDTDFEDAADGDDDQVMDEVGTYNFSEGAVSDNKIIIIYILRLTLSSRLMILV